ncbi:MAG TPA: hypothetical protein VHZ99_02810 [Steroidobacteraceae bacterium]|jgi:hypothetical protein|nr:hypothetical protein [Steroidobacteraceae bacterium]
MEFVAGQATGLRIPAHADALRAGGESWLTDAFHAFGSLPATNRVRRITRCEACPGGSTGHKLYLAVEYERPQIDLHTDLFVKFSRDFNNRMRDERGKFEMESEVRLAAISRLPAFPIHVPVAYFADFEAASKTGLIISQQIPFGLNGVEAHHPKCMDHEIPDPLAHYRTIIRALARIAAAHRSGRLSPHVEQQFPFDPSRAATDMPVIPYDAQGLHQRVLEYADFAARAPQLLPAAIRSAAFIERFDRDIVRFLEHEQRIRQFLHSNSELIALCHWNAQIDNAWFWRDERGALRCGLMDWGHVGQMNVAFSLWGCLSGAPQSIWERELEGLLRLFADELHGHGGPRLELAELHLHLQLYVAMMGLSYFIASPSRIVLARADVFGAAGPFDPMFRATETARNNLHILGVFLNLWRTQDFGDVLDRCLQQGRL